MPTAATQAIDAWLAENTVPLNGCETGAGFDDLAPLRAWIGDARVIGLGEATHDTREFFQLKHRMFEFLVSELDFTLFTIEAPFAESLAVNRYVQTGEGDARHSLTSMSFYCWDTEEVVELIDWMRTWNAEHERKIFFYGCDIQTSSAAVVFLLDFLQRHDPATYSRVRNTLQPFALDMHALDMRHRSHDDLVIMREAVADVASGLSQLSGETKEQRYELEIARLHTVVLAQNNALHFDSGLTHLQDVRDSAMADNVAALLALHGPSAKAVVWGHNDHIALQSSGWAGVTRPRLGQHLRERFGNDYLAFGFDFDHGTFGALDQMRVMRECAVVSEPETLGSVLKNVDAPIFALDLRDVPGHVADWFAQAPPARCIGGMYYPGLNLDPWIRCDIRTQFDFLLFVRETSAARHNPDKPYQSEFFRDEIDAPDAFENLDFSLGTTDWRHAQGNLGYSVMTRACGDEDELEISRSTPFWPHDVFMLSQTASAHRWRGKQITVRCAVSMQADHHGSSAQLAVRVLEPANLQFDFEGRSGAQFVWKRDTTRSARTRELAHTLGVSETADILAIALVITGDGRARFGPIRIDDGT